MSYFDMYRRGVNIDAFKGVVFDRIEGAVGDDVLKFYENGVERFRMYHSQDCCESVALEDISGDFGDLIGSPIVEAEAVTNSEDNPPQYAESFTWTFYKLGTIKGHVTLRWLGESNGYYSEEVDIADMQKEVAN